MGWLSYSDDEVERFHPEFESAANEALTRAHMQELYSWKHHPPQKGTGILPDFALLKKKTGEWLIVVEIKRRRESVFSTRYQYQAKSYAESNSRLYPTGKPRSSVRTRSRRKSPTGASCSSASSSNMA
ncbi:MAG: BpuSI family type II restriction endonuclease [Nitrososphaerales archaeon]